MRKRIWILRLASKYWKGMVHAKLGRKSRFVGSFGMPTGFKTPSYSSTLLLTLIRNAPSYSFPSHHCSSPLFSPGPSTSRTSICSLNEALMKEEVIGNDWTPVHPLESLALHPSDCACPDWRGPPNIMNHVTLRVCMEGAQSWAPVVAAFFLLLESKRTLCWTRR